MRCMIALFKTFKPNLSLIPLVPSCLHLRGSEVPLFSFEMRRWKTMGGTVILSQLNTPATSLLRAWWVLRWWQTILLQSVVVTFELNTPVTTMLQQCNWLPLSVLHDQPDQPVSICNTSVLTNWEFLLTKLWPCYSTKNWIWSWAALSDWQNWHTLQ